MTKEEAFDFIRRVYEHDDHKSGVRENSISCTTLIGPMFKAKLARDKAPKDESLINLMYKRSSSIGTAFHNYAAEIIESEDVICEAYHEKAIDDHFITGSCDIIAKNKKGTYTIMDWKTGYGKDRKVEALDKDRMQMSIYRWLFSELFEIDDKAYVLFVSQSNNVQEAYPIELMSIEETERYIEDKLFAIDQNESVDCNDGVKYNSCTYCSYVCAHRK